MKHKREFSRICRCSLSAAGTLTLAVMLGMPAAQAGKTDNMTVSASNAEAPLHKRSMEPLWEARRAPVTRSITVAVGDLNLNSKAGLERLYERLGVAARKVCEPRNAQYLQYLEQRREWMQCKAAALDKVVATSGMPSLVAMHHEATGRDIQSASQLAGTH